MYNAPRFALSVNEGNEDMPAEMIRRLRAVIHSEAEELSELAANLDTAVVTAVESIYACRGKIVTTGVGKSGFVAQKFSATLTSTGTPSVFLHPTDAVHGDLGVFTNGDLCFAFSSSGETREVVELLPYVRNIGIYTVSVVSRSESLLGRIADLSIITGVTHEVDRFNLIPTTSALAMHALCDAMCVGVMELREFSTAAYARLHPSGTIGKKLCWRVSDCMHTTNSIPKVLVSQTVAEAVLEITQKRLGATLVVDSTGKLVGIFTDGDLRRLVQVAPEPLAFPVSSVMSKAPVIALASDLALTAAQNMRDRRITVLPVLRTETDRRPVGIVHLHSLVSAGVIELRE